ncbi:hypothetical protein J0L31_12270 [Terrisporobacter glycolicus]|nr:hypothetical protein [Terrisporobacter glycolicus]
MASEMQKLIVRNIDFDSLLESISERDDLHKIINMFRYSEDYALREYMTIKEFCAYIKASDSYVRALLKYNDVNNLFVTTRVGREYRIDRISYEKWVSRSGGKF